MPEEIDNQSEEQITFWGGWKGIYLFILIYAALQIVLLYMFTVAFNNS